MEIQKPSFQTVKRVFKLLKQLLLLRQYFDYQQTVFNCVSPNQITFTCLDIDTFASLLTIKLVMHT